MKMLVVIPSTLVLVLVPPWAIWAFPGPSVVDGALWAVWVAASWECVTGITTSGSSEDEAGLAGRVVAVAVAEVEVV